MSQIYKFKQPGTLFDLTIRRLHDDTDKAVQSMEMHRSEVERFEKFCAVLSNAGFEIRTKILPLPFAVYFFIESRFDSNSRELVTTIKALGFIDHNAEAHDDKEIIHFSGPTGPNFTLSILGESCPWMTA